MLKKNWSFGSLALMSCIVIVTNAMAAAPEKVDAEKIAFLKDPHEFVLRHVKKESEMSGLYRPHRLELVCPVAKEHPIETLLFSPIGALT